MLGLLRLGAHTAAGATWWDFAVAGAGVGLCLTPVTQVAVSAVPAPRAGMAALFAAAALAVALLRPRAAPSPRGSRAEPAAVTTVRSAE